jgi:hypothetical protein
MSDFLVALGLLFVIEGLMCAALPNAIKRAVDVILETPEGTMRIVGIFSAVLGLAIIWLVRG